VQANTSTEAVDIELSGIGHAVELLGNKLMSRYQTYEEHETLSVLRGSPDHFEVESTDGVSVSSRLLAEVISNHPNVGMKLSRPPESPADNAPPKKRQRVDISTLAY
jgi:hypothetical protein